MEKDEEKSRDGKKENGGKKIRRHPAFPRLPTIVLPHEHGKRLQLPAKQPVHVLVEEIALVRERNALKGGPGEGQGAAPRGVEHGKNTVRRQRHLRW